MTRRHKWVLLLAALAVGLIALLLLFDWNWLKGPLERRVSAALGRAFEIAGPLEVDLALQPRITVANARLANPDWASDGPMLAVERVEVVIDLQALLRGRIELPEVSISKPALRLETRPNGPPNWKFKDGPSEGPPAIPQIGRLRIADAAIRYLEHGSGRDIAARLAEVSGSSGKDHGLTLTATGQIADQPLDLTLSGPPIARLAERAAPYAVDVDLQLGASDLAGELTLDLGKEVPAISATLRSDQVRMRELAGLIGAGAAGSTDPAEGAAGPRRLDPERLPRLDADLDYTLGTLEGPDLTLRDVKLEAGLHDRLPSLVLTGQGSFRGEPVALDVTAKPSEGAGPAQPHYRIDAEITAGKTRFTAAGAIEDPERLQGVELQLEAQSPDLAKVLAEVGIDLPTLPGLQVAGQLIGEGDRWRLENFYAELGESNLSGRLEVDLARARPFLSADLRSDRLRAVDLLPRPTDRQAAKDEAAEAAAEAPAIITPAGIDFEALPAWDADVRFRGDYVQAPAVLLDRLTLDLELRERSALVDATGEGRFRDFERVAFEAHAGSEASLEDPQARYPVDLALQAGDSRASLKGSLGRPLGLTDPDIDVVLEGPGLQALGEILKRPLPATPPYDLRAKVSHQADQQRWNLVAIRGTVGDSDLAGDVSLELAGPRPTVVADLKSQRLDFDDLGVFVGAPPDVRPGETASPEQRQEAAAAEAAPHVLPDKPFNLPDLGAIDANVRFEGEAVQARKLPLENLSLELTLKDGKLRLEPLRLDVADGQVEVSADLDSRDQALEGSFDLSLKRIRLNRLLANFDIKLADIELEKEGVGTFGGRARLSARGNSIHDLAATTNGELAIIMGGGQINALILEAIGLDAGEVLGLLLTEEREGRATTVPVQCFIARFGVQQGVMQTQALVLETSDSTITGQGQIDLGKEALALQLLAHPKDPSVLTATTPVRIEGTFKRPKIDVISEELKQKSLAALALGVVMPLVGAILPFLEPGETTDSNCGQLIEAASAAMPPAPSPTSE